MSVKKREHVGSRIPLSLQLLNIFFKAVIDRKFTEAEKILQEMEEKSKGNEASEFKRGFILGLKGIIIMQRSNDQFTILSNLDLSNIEMLKKYYSIFSANAKSKLHADYDRGYFLALAEYTLFALRYTKTSQKNNT